MNSKAQLVSMLKEVFDNWEELIASVGEERINLPNVPSNMSIKDEIAHLWAWQQISVARMEAALHNREPEYPGWREMFGPDPEDDVDQTNAWIYETNRDKLWPSVFADWRAQFLSLVELAEAVPEKDLLDQGRYEWLEGDALSAVIEGSYEHHVEHLEELLARLGQSGSIKE